MQSFTHWMSAHRVGLRNTLLGLVVLGGLTACLDLPVQGTVAGEQMGYVFSSWYVGEGVVPVSPPEAQGLSQVVLSDYVVGCADIERAAGPAPDAHSIAISFIPVDGVLTPGTYRVEALENQNRAAATFVFGRGTRVVQQVALEGEIELLNIEGDLVEGVFSLGFMDGTLDGFFSSERCP